MIARERVRRLLDRADTTQPTLNGIAFDLGLVTMQADAETVRRRLRAWVETACCPNCKRPTEWIALSGGDRVESLCDPCAGIKASYTHDDGRDLSDLRDGEA